jgi:hypothetical protein
MTQEHKDLLLKDLCARLPYGVKVEIKYHDDVWKLLAIYTNGTTYATRDMGYPIETYFEDCKPYLFPLSSMTEEQKKEYDSIIYHNVELHWERYYDVIDVDCCEELYDFYNKNHLDYRGLIPMGLAIDATVLNIY